jgi:hypothetical protein
MFKRTHDVITIVVNFISSEWEAKHVTIGLFEVIDISGVAMVPKLQELLDKFSLIKIFLPMLGTKGLTCKLVKCPHFYCIMRLCGIAKAI